MFFDRSQFLLDVEQLERLTEEALRQKVEAESGFKTVLKRTLEATETKVENDKTLFMVAMPGVCKEGVTVEVRENKLVLTGVSAVKSSLVKETTTHTFALDKNADVANIKATMADGLLTVTVPRVEPVVRVSKIAVS